MQRWARVSRVLATILAVTASGFGQLIQLQSQNEPGSPAPRTDANSKAEKEKETIARHKAALTLLDQVLSGSRNLSLPQNRITIASEALGILWGHNEAQARSLVTEIVGDFAQAGAQENLQSNDRQLLRQQRQNLVGAIAQLDAELALSFMTATKPFVRIGDPDQEEAEERNLQLELATQEASRNPRNALRLAKKELEASGNLPQELISLLSQVAAKDPEAGAQLLHELLSRLRSADFSAADSNFHFALNLLNTERNSSAEGAPPDSALKTLAEAIAAGILSPDFPAQNLPILEGSIPAFELYAPARVPALRERVEDFIRRANPQQRMWDQFNAAQASGDPNQLLAAAEQAPADYRSNMVQQVAWQFANNGDVQHVQQITDKMSDPSQREQVVQQAIRQSAWNAANRGDYATARQVARDIMPEEDRAVLLAQVASNAATARQAALAQEMLEEAGGLVANCPPGAATFLAQLQVAQAFAHVTPARALPLMERSAEQIEQVLSAALEVDAFLPYQHSFEAGELILNQSFLFNSLVRPYAEAAGQLAGDDLPAARILADRLSHPEARLFADLAVARGALGDAPTAGGGVGFGEGGGVGGVMITSRALRY